MTEETSRNDPPWMASPPTRLLLATDLSARCDRSLDRAAQLAGEWNAELVALNVLETPQAPDLALAWMRGECSDESCMQMAHRQLKRDLADLKVRTSVRIARGDAADTICKIASGTDCDLVVTGVARNETLGRFLLGSTVECLARCAPQPLLVVRDRPRGGYRHIVVATDFSESARHALHAAARFFPDRDLVLFHAYSQPMSAIAGRDPVAPAVRDIKQEECDGFLAASQLPPETRRRLQIVMEPGSPENVLTRYVRAHDVELVVMGTHGRSGLMNVVLGSTAARLLEWLPCDTMIVRELRSKPPA